jgi:hypothetical protein
MANAGIKRVVVVFGARLPRPRWLKERLGFVASVPPLSAPGRRCVLMHTTWVLAAAAMEAEATPFITQLDLKKDEPAM